MAYQSCHRFARIAPGKVRPVASLIRGKPLNRALELLRGQECRGSYFLNKVLRAALSCAEADRDVDVEDLVVVDVRVDGGSMLKRWRPRARGSASRILKRTSHILVGLDVRSRTEAAGAPGQDAPPAEPKKGKEAGKKERGAAPAPAPAGTETPAAPGKAEAPPAREKAETPARAAKAAKPAAAEKPEKAPAKRDGGKKKKKD